MAWYSRKYNIADFSQPLSLDQMITIYEDQVLGWFLDVARELHPKVATDFVTLMIITSFFEGHAIFLEGRDSFGQEREMFKKGFKAVLSQYFIDTGQSIEDAVELVWERIRCGLFHAGMTLADSRVFRGDSTNQHPPLHIYSEQGQDILVINPPQLQAIVEDYFRSYIAKLRDPKSEYDPLRRNFQRGWIIRARTKDIRKTLILDEIRQSPNALTKRDIADRLFMTKGAASNLLKELTAEGVIIEEECPTRTGIAKVYRIVGS